MDELALLKDFRLEDAAPDGAREHARAALRAAMTAPALPPPPVRDRARLRASRRCSLRRHTRSSTSSSSARPRQRTCRTRSGCASPSPARRRDSARGPGPYKLAGPAADRRGRRRPRQGPSTWLLADARAAANASSSGTRASTGRTVSRSRAGLAVSASPSPAQRSATPTSTTAARRGIRTTCIEGYAPGAVRMRIGSASSRRRSAGSSPCTSGPSSLTAYGAHGGVVARVRLKTPTEKAHRSTPAAADEAGRADSSRSASSTSSSRRRWAGFRPTST